MVDRYKSTKCVDRLLRHGLKRKTTDQLIQYEFKSDQRKSASTVKAEIENERGISLQVDTIGKLAHELGLLGRVTRKKPCLNKINREKRLKFGKEMLENPVDFCKNIVWSDESNFNLFGLDGKVMIWKTPGEEFDPKCTIPIFKHGGG